MPDNSPSVSHDHAAPSRAPAAGPSSFAPGDRLRRLNQWKERLLGPGTLHERLTLLTDAVVDVFEADFARIWVIMAGDLCNQGCRHAELSEGPEVCRDRSQCLHLLASSGRYADTQGSHRRVPLGVFEIGRLGSEGGNSYVTNDVTHDPRIHDHAWAKELGLVSFAGYRILSPEGTTQGVLALFSKHLITPAENALLADLANTASHVIRAGLAEESLRKARDELEVRVQQRTAELSEAVAELGKAKEAAEAGSRAKSAFLADMSHEIRTPLNAIIGMTELVLQGQLTQQQRDFLSTVKDSGEGLLSIINDILDFSKIEAGKLILDHEVFDLRESLGDTVKTFAYQAHRKGLELACLIAPDTPRLLVGDYHRLRQIFVNLVGNALKFTEQGEVIVEVRVESRCDLGVMLHGIVSDTGVGIPKEKQAAIFSAFEQVDTLPSRRLGGTGLGLAIARRLVALMEGSMWVESEPAHGSKFHFTVHLGVPQGDAQESAPSEPPAVHGLRVLIVDDNATNRRILEENLLGWKMVPSTAADANEAIALLKSQQAAGEPFRLVLTDARMPRGDGFLLTEWIKNSADLCSTVVIMLASSDDQDERSRHAQLGIAAWILKPIKQSELLRAIEQALQISDMRAAPLPIVERPPRRTGLRLLLAEDSVVNQKLAMALLQGAGHFVTAVNNGREAVQSFEPGKFDAILMDVLMPEMDGLEATTQIRALEEHTATHMPIIAMTALAVKGDRERCLEAGMDGYITKPIRPAELFDTIEAMCGQQEPLAHAQT